jgi:HNH endonuclease
MVRVAQQPTLSIAVPRYGEPTLVCPRLGQGAFRLTVTDVYGRCCAVTKEKTLPILEAAHIRAYKDGGAHEVTNGLLLRRDIHRLFDLGYVTISTDGRFEVGRRLKDDYENGHHYYAMHGQSLSLPRDPLQRPAREVELPATGWKYHGVHRLFSHGIGHVHEYNRERARLLQHGGNHRRVLSDDEVRLSVNQLSCECPGLFGISGGPANVDPDIAPIRPAQCLKPFQKSRFVCPSGLSARPISTPIRRIRSPCCARAASGHAVAPPSNVMNARRFTRSPRQRGRAASAELRDRAPWQSSS